MLTKEQWYTKLRSWVPKLFFEEEHYNAAIFKGMAAVLAAMDATAQAHFRETFILQSEEFYVDAHGDERTTPRLAGEPDALYKKRVQILTNFSDLPDIKALVDAFLIVGESIIIEHMTDGPYCNRDTYLNNRFIFTNRRWYDYFTILVPKQIPISDCFCNVDTYLDRANFIGSTGPLPASIILASIAAVVQQNKAGGVLFRLIEE